MNREWRLWIRAENDAEAAERGRKWADAEPALEFVRVVGVEPHPEFYGVYTVTVETADRIVAPLSLGL